jgi:hypothetical protein
MKIMKRIMIVVWVALTFLMIVPAVHAIPVSYFVAAQCNDQNPSACTRNGSGVGFAYSTVSVYVDPAETNWIAWHDKTAPTNVGGKDYVGGYSWIAVDDYLSLTITNPLGETMTQTMDWNDAWGTSSGPQAVIYGTAADAPDVERWNWFQSHKTFDEAGLFNSFFNTAGTYDFSFDFRNIWTMYYGMPDVYLLVDSAAPAPVPEPATMILLGSGIGGLAVFRKKLRALTS